VLLTRELDDTIRRCEIAGVSTGVATARRLRPELPAEAIEVAGGLVAFTGVDSPLSQAVGVGWHDSVRRENVSRIVEFYEARGTASRVFVTPLSHPTLARELAAAGFVPSEYENVMVSDDFGPALSDARVGIAADLHAWARASAEAFMDPEVPQPGDDFIAVIIASSPGVLPLEARVGDEIVATAAMDLRDGCAGLFAGSVAPGFRRRGWHNALIRDRIARARDGGATLMRATARPGSPSEFNFQRSGFTTLYTRTLWERKLERSRLE
jgi:hypothetical protein